MARFPAVRKGQSFVPSTQDGRDFLNRVAHGGDVMISVTTARNIRQFNLFWALCEIVADHFEITKEAAKEELCTRTGHVEPVFYSDGSMRLRPKSIAFENMPQDAFDPFFKLAVSKVIDWLGAAPQEVIDHVFSLIDPAHSPSIAPETEREKERVE